MLRRIAALFGIAVALAMVAAGLWLPARFRAVAPEVLQQARQAGQGVTERAALFLRRGQTGPAGELLTAAQELDLDTEGLPVRLDELLSEHPGYRISGGPSPFFDAFIQTLPRVPEGDGKNVPLAALLASSDNRARLAGFLSKSKDPTVAALLKTRTLAGWRQLFPVDAPGGAALDIAALSTALLAQTEAFNESVLLDLDNAARAALEGDPQALLVLERAYLSVLAAAGRFNWLTLEAWVESSPGLNGLARITPWLRKSEQPAMLYSAVILSQQAGHVAAFLEAFPDEGEADLAAGVAGGSMGLAFLLDGPRPIFERPVWLQWLPEAPPELAQFAFRRPVWARGAVVGLWLVAGLLLAICLKALLWGQARVHERPLIEGSQDVILAGCLLLGLIVATEPGLLSQTVTEPGKLFLEFELGPQSASVGDTSMDISGLDQITLLVLLIFFVVQLVIYTGCLVKIGQVKRAPASAEVRLKLLENEDNLFDTGLYVGLSGTVISLLMLAMGVVQASLVAAYASTLFGIIFVALLKILHVRPLRRKLILEAERF